MSRSRFLSIFLIFISLIWGERIELFSGEILESEALEYRDGVLTLEDTTVRRDGVKSILFESDIETSPLVVTSSDVQTALEEASEATGAFPNASGIILLDHGHFVRNEDGSVSFTYHFRAKILKSERKDWANVSIRFEEERSRVHLLAARTIKPDGRVFLLDESEVRILKPTRDLVYFDTDKYFTFSLPQVAVGDIVEYKYTLETFNPWNPDFFNPAFYFQSDEPMWVTRLAVTLPVWESLTYGSRNMPEGFEEPRVQKGSDRTTYTWELRRMDATVEEPMMPPWGDVVPKVEASNHENWSRLYRWYGEFQRRRMEVSPEIQGIAREITSGAVREEEKVARLYHWVQRQIRYISIKSGPASGMSGHPARETLENGYGDCTDVAILFAALLDAVGIDAYPVYVGTNDEVGMLMPSVPSWYGNHCINQVDLSSGETIYLDATGTTSRFPSFWAADHGIYAVNALKKEINLIPVPVPEMNSRNYEYAIDLDEKGNARILFRSSYVGEWEDGVRWYWEHVKEDQREFMFNNMIHEVSPEAELVSYRLNNVSDISEPFSMEIEYVLRDYASGAGDLLILRLPEILDRLTFDEVSLATRAYPLSYPTSMQIVHSYEIAFPESFEIGYVPEDVRFDGRYAEFEATYRVDGNHLEHESRFLRPERIVPSEEYEEYRELLQRISSYVESEIYFMR
jgi:transglutaminase-like putative cysteine protease